MQKAKIILGAGGLVFGVLLCELILHLAYPQVYRRPEVWRYDSDLGWGHVPNGAGRLVSPEFDVEMRISATGLRDREFAVGKAEGTRRIAFYGDSFVEGWGVAIEAAVSRRLEACLQQKGERVEVANYGVAGYGTDQALLYFEKTGWRFSPDDVGMFFYGNDLWNNTARKGSGAERGFKPYFRQLPDGKLHLRGVPVRKSVFWDRDLSALPLPRRLDRYLSQHWHLYRLGQKALQPEIKPAQQQAFYEGLYGVDEGGRFDPAWSLTGRLLGKFKESIERHGARPIVVYVPSIVQIENDNWATKRDLHGLVGEFDLQKPNAKLAHFAAHYGLRLIDLHAAFAERAASETLYWRDSHWNEAGHALAGQVLCGELAQGTP